MWKVYQKVLGLCCQELHRRCRCGLVRRLGRQPCTGTIGSESATGTGVGAGAGAGVGTIGTGAGTIATGTCASAGAGAGT